MSPLIINRAKASLNLTCSSMALLLLSFSPATASAQGFQSCADMMHGAKCETASSDSEVFRMCCPARAGKSTAGDSASTRSALPQISASVAGKGNLSSEMGCFASLRGISHGDGTDLELGEKSTLLLPATANGARGFYLFTENSAYFQAFPAKPQNSNEQNNYYYFKLQLPGKESQYIIYAADKSNDANPRVAISPGPMQAYKDLYRKVENNDALNEQSRAVLSGELQSRVKSVTQAYQENLAISKNQVQMYGHYGPIPELKQALEFQKSGKTETSKSLNSCVLKDDKSLRVAVAEEQDRLARVNPAISGSDQPSTGVKATGAH